MRCLVLLLRCCRLTLREWWKGAVFVSATTVAAVAVAVSGLQPLFSQREYHADAVPGLLVVVVVVAAVAPSRRARRRRCCCCRWASYGRGANEQMSLTLWWVNT